MTILFPYMARWNSANMSRYYHLFNKIAGMGHRVIVIQPPPRVSDETNYIDLPMAKHLNIELHTVSMHPAIWNRKLPFDKFVKKAMYTIGSLVTTRKLMLQYRPDILVLYNLPQYIYTVRSRVPFVFDYADDYMAMLQHELGITGRHPISFIGTGILRRLIRKAALVTTVSDILYKSIEHDHKFLLPNGADEPSRHEVKTLLHIDRDRPVIGYVGAFEYFINLDLMLDAASRLPRHTFLLVGAGRELGRVKDSVAARKLENVILTGAVPHEQAVRFIQEMDICLNPFNPGPVADAASPIKLFEYMACGKPIITTRLKETERLDADGNFLYYADNVVELVDAIQHVLSHPEEKQRKVSSAMAIVKAQFSWTAIARQFVNAVEGTLRVREGAAA